MNINYTISFETATIQPFKITIDNILEQPIQSITIAISSNIDKLTYQSLNVLYDVDFITFPDINTILTNQPEANLLYISIISNKQLINLNYEAI